MAKVTYAKPYRSVEQLIELLKARGLVFDGDEDAARRYLSCVNYYRFTGYALPFLASREQFPCRLIQYATTVHVQACHPFQRIPLCGEDPLLLREACSGITR